MAASGFSLLSHVDLPAPKRERPSPAVVGGSLFFIKEVSLMVNMGGRCKTGMTMDVLEREVYTEAAAARLLRVVPGTLHYWL